MSELLTLSLVSVVSLAGALAFSLYTSARAIGRLQKSFDDALMQIVALKNPYAAQAFGAAKSAQAAENVAAMLAQQEPRGADADPDEDRYG